jgi:isopentenyl-diphosphate delta-isomerase
MPIPDPADHATDLQVVTIGHGGSLGPPVSKQLAHFAPGILHLAVSVQAVDTAGCWLLQRRAATKSAFADRWANTCSTHPRPGERPEDAAIRRLHEETGLVASNLVTAGVFVYRATDSMSGLVEHEVNHVYVAVAVAVAVTVTDGGGGGGGGGGDGDRWRWRWR